MSKAVRCDEPEDQTAVIDFLGSAAAYGRDVVAVERIETHGALVFLAGEHVYKIKRAVRFPYMDFSPQAPYASAAR